MLDIVENVSCGLEDRCRPRTGGGIGRGAGVDRPRLEAITDIGRRQWLRLTAPVGRRLRRTIADDAGVDTAPRQLPAQTAEFDLGTTVHDDFNSGRLGFFGG